MTYLDAIKRAQDHAREPTANPFDIERQVQRAAAMAYAIAVLFRRKLPDVERDIKAR